MVYNTAGLKGHMAQKASVRTEEGHRRSERVLLRIPIEVKGTQENGKPFKEKAFTLVVNRHGARISLNNTPRVEDRLTITNLQTEISCPFRVVRRLANSLGEGPEWGVECLEPEVNFWGIFFPSKTAAPTEEELIDALLECSVCRYRELAQLSLNQYRSLASQGGLQRDCSQCGRLTDWKFGFAEAEMEESPAAEQATAAATSAAGAGPERRRAKRLTIKLPVRIRLLDGGEEVTRTENISRTGVCFVSDLAAKEGETIYVTVGYTSQTPQPEIPARVVWRRTAAGMDKCYYGVHLAASS